MSQFVVDDWKLKARTVVKLYRKNTNTLVCGRVVGKKQNSVNPEEICYKLFFALMHYMGHLVYCIKNPNHSVVRDFCN